MLGRFSHDGRSTTRAGKIQRCHTGSLNSDTQFQFRRQRVVKTEAAGYPESDGSIISGAQKGMLKSSSIKSSGWGNNIKEFQVRCAEGLYMDGGHGQGGQGHGGNGRSDDDNSGGYGGLEGSDGPIGLEWWWWWQWQRQIQRSHNTFGCAYDESEPLWLTNHRMVQMITSELGTLMDTMISLGPSMLAAGELSRVILMDQVFPALVILPILPFFIVHFHLMMEELLFVFVFIAGAFMALAAVFLVAVIWLLARWNNRDQNESDDGNGE